MKSFVILTAAASLAFVGCENRDTTIDESAGAARDQIEQAADSQQEALDQQKDNIEQRADQAQEQISEEARAQKEQIEARAEAEQAQIEAQKKQVEAQAEAAQADATAQEQINEAAGAANTQVQGQGTSDNDRNLTEQVRRSIMSTYGQDNPSAAKNITVITMDGKVTLKGSVATEADKQSLEAQAKATPGVTSVDNQLEVK